MAAPSLTKILQNDSPPNVALAKAAELNPVFLKSCLRVVDQICDQIEDSFPERVGKIKHFVRGGSLGNDTVVWGRDDIDSVIVVCFDYGTTDINELVKLHKSKSRKIMDTIEERVVNITSYDVEVDEVTDSGISCTVSIPNGPLDVSVYVMATFHVDVTKENVREAIYTAMDSATTEDREILGSSLSELQVDFIKNRHQQVKCLMRLVKFWAQKGFNDKDDQQLPAPYLLELITVFCWEHANSPETFKFASAFNDILLTLKDYKSIKAIWTSNYSYNRASNVAKTERPPIVVDPANPNVNLARDCNAWDEVARGADQTLKAALFSKLTSPRGVWR